MQTKIKSLSTSSSFSRCFLSLHLLPLFPPHFAHSFPNLPPLDFFFHPFPSLLLPFSLPFFRPLRFFFLVSFATLRLPVLSIHRYRRQADLFTEPQCSRWTTMDGGNGPLMGNNLQDSLSASPTPHSTILNQLLSCFLYIISTSLSFLICR